MTGLSVLTSVAGNGSKAPAPEPAGRGSGDLHDERRRAVRHRRRRRLLIAGVVVVLAILAVGAWVLFGGEKPRAVTTQEAHDRTEGATVSTAPAGELGPPAGGVYLYEGEGTEDTSFPPLSETQGPTMPATVTPDGEGCWRFRIDYNTHHWQDWRFCADGSGIVSTGGQSFARRVFGALNVDNISTFEFTEPEAFLWAGMEVGDERVSRSTGSGTAVPDTTTVTGTMTYVGDEQITVDGREVTAVHLRSERVFSGAQEGSEEAEWWIDPETALPYRNERQLSVQTQYAGMDITYTEVADFHLTDLVPL